jgi:hypothetical protein
MASRQTFTISYDGEALREGRMDVRELAPALLAAGDLFQSANRILNHDRSTVSVQVQGQFRTGSFPVVFSVDQSPIEIVQGLLHQYPQIKDAKEILEILFFYGGIGASIGTSVVKLMKWLKGDKPKESQFTFTNNGTVIINLGDRQTEAKAETFNLAMDRSVRNALEGWWLH